MCGGVKSSVGTWHRFLHNKGNSENLNSPSQISEETVTEQTQKYFHCCTAEFTVVSELILVKK